MVGQRAESREVGPAGIVAAGQGSPTKAALSSFACHLNEREQGSPQETALLLQQLVPPSGSLSD